MIRSALFAASAALVLAAASGPAVAQTAALNPAPVGLMPAVSQHALKVDVFGGSIDGITGYGSHGAFSFPIGDRFGAQIDAMVGLAADEVFRGVGGHVFWRDPRTLLLGLYGSWVDWGLVGARVSKLGGEVEWYHGPLSFEGMLAIQGGDFSGLAARATVAFYIHDNLRLDASYRLLQGIGDIGAVGVEWQHQNTGLALFANGSWGQNGYRTVIGGVRFYAGQSKSLVQRHREDDPVNPEPWDLFVGKPVCRVGTAGPLKVEAAPCPD